MSFRMINSELDLPSVGTAREAQILEFKSIYDKKIPDGTSGNLKFDHFEMAKDIAAFANASGGILLIGAHEDRSKGVLGKYSPMSQEAAKEIVSSIEKAIIERCSPIPLINAAIIPKGMGFVVAVNVYPFPGQVIGVRAVTTKGDEYGGASYVFFLRSGTNNIPIEPEQLPMLMLSDLRRSAILLSQIPRNSGMNIILRVIAEDGLRRNPNEIYGTLIDFDIMTNTMMIKAKKATELNEITIAVPLDLVKSVWKSNGVSWYVAIAGVWFLSHEEYVALF